MKRLPIPDFDSTSDPANIERILKYLSLLEDVPMVAVDALRGLLARAEYVAEPGHDPDTVTVVMPAHRRGEHERHVHLIDVTFTCKVCGKTQTITTYPGGKRPTVCQGEGNQRSECQRTANRQQMKVARDLKKHAGL